VGITAQIVPFIEDMANAYAAADIVVCRAGAITVSELCAAGVPAVLVPFLASTTRHQAGNADYMQNQGAGIHLPQAQLTAQRLADILQGLARENLLALAQAARALGRQDATAQVVSVIEQAASTRLTPHSPLTQASA
jgi:UDP-N-acetylglucosamine--N-acetylmuramyl-(pentapeptide) pyrophosphoryl-undecaprenol N-acetylglucosamine transferase